MASLYEIRQEIEGFDFEVDPETGEFLNSMQWDELNMAHEEKCENIACYIKNLTYEVENFKAEEKAIAERRKRKERKVEYLKRLLLENMDGTKFETPKCSISFRKSEQVQISDESIVPNSYMKETVTYKPDKTEIKKAIKSGQTISGCELVECLNVNIK